MKKIEINDDFPCRCRGITLSGKRCSRRAVILSTVSDRDSWLAAIKTGWPAMKRGMIEPKWRHIGTCLVHMSKWDKATRNGKEFRLWGAGSYGKVKLDKDYEEAKAIGDRERSELTTQPGNER